MTTLQTIYAEGRLIRGKWSDTDEQGRELLCLYTALAGDPDARPDGCPADLAPRWIAHLLPWLDDAPSNATWPKIIERVIAIAPRLAEVPPEVEWRVRALSVREATRHTDDAEVLGVCERVATLCERRGRGEVVPDEEMGAAAWAASRASQTSRALAWASPATKATASTASRVAAWVASRAAQAATWAAQATSDAASRAATWAAWAAGAWKEEAATAADRLADAILTELERSLS